MWYVLCINLESCDCWITRGHAAPFDTHDAAIDHAAMLNSSRKLRDAYDLSPFRYFPAHQDELRAFGVEEPLT